MNLLTILGMVEAGHSDRLVLGTQGAGLTGGELAVRARRGGLQLTARSARTVVFIGENGTAFPLALFAAAAAGIQFLPLNYRLSHDQLAAIAGQQDRPFIIADNAERLGCDAAAGTRRSSCRSPESPRSPWLACRARNGGSESVPSSCPSLTRH